MTEKFEFTFRAVYSDTDQMGFMHHANYAKHLETARWEVFRTMGLSYKDIESNGILMPVIDMQFRFIKPILYDDLIRITLRMQLIGSTRLLIKYQLFNEENLLVHKAETTLAFIRKETKKPCRVPDSIRELLSENLSEN